MVALLGLLAKRVGKLQYVGFDFQHVDVTYHQALEVLTAKIMIALRLRSQRMQPYQFPGRS